MKRSIIFSIFAVCISLAFFGCKKNKDEKPIAEFTATPIANGGVEVTFSGKGSPTWDFGGSGVTIGSGNTVRFYYKNNGTYTIKLTAKVNSGASNEKSQSLNITGVPTKVNITKVELLNFRDTNNVGAPWDNDATGPDIQFVYYDGVTYTNLTSTLPNITHAQLPIASTITPAKSGNMNLFYIYCFDDNYSTEAIEGFSFQTYNYTANNPCTGGCVVDIYPTTYTSSTKGMKKMKITLEWLP